MKIVLRSILFYALIGPLIGAALMVTISLLMFFVGHDDLVLADLLVYVVRSVVLAYPMGILQAILVGWIVGLGESRSNFSNIVLPLAAGAVAWFGFATTLFWLLGGSSDTAVALFLSWTAIVWFVVHIVAAVCTWLLRRRLRRKQST